MHTLILYGLVLAVAAGALWGAYDVVDSRGYDRAKAECERAAVLERERQLGQANLAATEVADDDAKARVVFRTITKTVDKYIDRPVYRNVCFDADGLRDANAALVQAHRDAGQPDLPLPGPDATQ